MHLSTVCLTAIIIDPTAMTTQRYADLHEVECQAVRSGTLGEFQPYELDPRSFYICWDHGLIAHYKSKKLAQQIKPYEIEALYLKAHHCKPINIDNAAGRSW